MATLTERRAWTGRIRAQLKDTLEDLTSLVNYNTKHPTYAFIDPTTLSEIESVQSWIEARLVETRLR